MESKYIRSGLERSRQQNQRIVLYLSQKPVTDLIDLHRQDASEKNGSKRARMRAFHNAENLNPATDRCDFHHGRSSMNSMATLLANIAEIGIQVSASICISTSAKVVRPDISSPVTWFRRMIRANQNPESLIVQTMNAPTVTASKIQIIISGRLSTDARAPAAKPPNAAKPERIVITCHTPSGSCQIKVPLCAIF